MLVLKNERNEETRRMLLLKTEEYMGRAEILKEYIEEDEPIDLGPFPVEDTDSARSKLINAMHAAMTDDEDRFLR